MRGRLITLHARRLVSIIDKKCPQLNIKINESSCAKWDSIDGVPDEIFENMVIAKDDKEAICSTRG